jgi:hypothetical protein
MQSSNQVTLYGLAHGKASQEPRKCEGLLEKPGGECGQLLASPEGLPGNCVPMAVLLAKQALYLLSHVSSPFCLVYFAERISHFCLG